jgi:hypothetical protein
MEHLAKCLKENRPNISDSTIKTYSSLLKSFFYKHHEKSVDINCEWFQNQDDIIELLKDKPASTRKTTFAALVALVKENEKYKKAMMNDSKTYQEFIDTQTKTKTQEDNWKSFDEVKKIYDDMYNRVKPLLNSKEVLSTKDFKLVQDFIILALTSGVWISPRRSMDWCEMKIKNVDKGHCNYIDKNFFVFNKYKTAKFYDEQRVEIPKGLKLILNKWIKINPHDYLLVDSNNNKMTNVKLTQRLNAIFDGRISTSMLRHIFITEKLKDVPALKELKQMAQDMAHSVSEQLTYIKN